MTVHLNIYLCSAMRPLSGAGSCRRSWSTFEEIWVSKVTLISHQLCLQWVLYHRSVNCCSSVWFYSIFCALVLFVLFSLRDELGKHLEMFNSLVNSCLLGAFWWLLWSDGVIDLSHRRLRLYSTLNLITHHISQISLDLQSCSSIGLIKKCGLYSIFRKKSSARKIQCSAPEWFVLLWLNLSYLMKLVTSWIQYFKGLFRVRNSFKFRLGLGL